MVMHKWLNGLQWYGTIRYRLRYDCHAFFALVLSERLRKERREKAGELLARLREKHEFDKERARRSYTESRLVLDCFNVVLSEASAVLNTPYNLVNATSYR
ncbi:unnamed protein product [Ascophyllum nodosum]